MEEGKWFQVAKLKTT